jgi:hypothetical protein
MRTEVKTFLGGYAGVSHDEVKDVSMKLYSNGSLNISAHSQQCQLDSFPTILDYVVFILKSSLRGSVSQAELKGQCAADTVYLITVDCNFHQSNRITNSSILLNSQDLDHFLEACKDFQDSQRT